MGHEKLLRQEGAARREHVVEKHPALAPALAASSAGLELALGAASRGVKAPWVTAGLRSAGLTIPQIASVASHGEAASLHEAGLATAHHAQHTLDAATLQIETTAKQLAAHLRGHFEVLGMELDSHRALQAQKVRAACVTQRAQLRHVIGQVRNTIIEGESSARAQLAVQERAAQEKADGHFLALPSAYETRASCARSVADGLLAQYRRYAQKQKDADPTPATMLDGDLAQGRFEARVETGRDVHARYLHEIDGATQKKVTVAQQAHNPVRIQVRSAVTQTVASLRDGELKDVRMLVSRAIDTELERLVGYLGDVETLLLHTLEARTTKARAHLRATEHAAATALQATARSSAEALRSSVSAHVHSTQESVGQGTVQAQHTLTTIDALLRQPGVARGPAAQRLRTLRVQLVARIAAAGHGLRGRAGEVGGQVAHGAAQVSASLHAQCEHVLTKSVTQHSMQLRMIDQLGARGVAELAALVATVAGESGGLAAKMKGAFQAFVADAPKTLAALDAKVQAVLDADVRGFGIATMGRVRDEAPSMYDVMVDEGDKAARAVRARWKRLVKLTIALVIGVAVGVASAALAPTAMGFVAALIGKGLLATILGGALSGAVAGAMSGVLMQLGNNAVDQVGDPAPVDARGNDITAGYGILGAKGALVTGLWTGALGGAVTTPLGAALAGPLAGRAAGAVANAGVDAVSQLATTDHYSVEAGLENLVLGALIGAGTGLAASRVAHAAGVESHVGVERPVNAAERAYGRGETLGDRVALALSGEAPVPKGVVHAGAEPELHLAQMQKHGLVPGKSFQVGEATFRIGRLFQIEQGRVGVHVYVTVNGKTYLRIAYRSNSQGGFRLLPAVNERVIGKPYYDKAHGEHALMLPREVQERLGQQLEDRGARRDLAPADAKQAFEDGVARNQGRLEHDAYERSADHASRHVRQEKILAPVEPAHAHDPSRVRVANEAHRPDYQRLVSRSTRSSALAGKIEALVYHSFDGSLEYVVAKDAHDHVWIESIAKVGAKITPLGLPDVAIDAEALTTPLWEYHRQIPGGPGATHPHDVNYASAWRYVRELPEVKAWYAATGTPVPNEASQPSTAKGAK